MINTPEWLQKPLEQLNETQWEALCDGCALCCLHKLEDEQSGDIIYTRVACRLLDIKSCRCTDYVNRSERVAACVTLAPDRQADFLSLPETCAYRRRYLGKALPEWHPLLCGNAEQVHIEGISVRDQAISENDFGEVDENAPLMD